MSTSENQSFEEISKLLEKLDLKKEQLIVSTDEKSLLIVSKSKKNNPLKLLNFISNQTHYNWNLLSKQNREKLLNIISQNIEIHVSEIAHKFTDLQHLMEKINISKEDEENSLP